MAIHQLKVTLAGVTPLIWRRIQVRSSTTLAELHEVLQIAMGWENYHLHAFAAGRHRYEGGAEAKARLADVLPNEGDDLIYSYDFGDDWQHVVAVERILSLEGSATTFPRCTGGRRACPPEDSGGPWGYADMLKALRARKGPRYQEIRETLPRRFDPESLDLVAVNEELATLSTAATHHDR